MLSIIVNAYQYPVTDWYKILVKILNILMFSCFFIDVKYDIKRFERYILINAVLFSIFLIYILIFVGNTRESFLKVSICYCFVNNWPTIILSMLTTSFVLFLKKNNHIGIIGAIIVLVGMLSLHTRNGIVIVLIFSFYFLVKKLVPERIIFYALILGIAIINVCIIFFSDAIYEFGLEMEDPIFYFRDRNNIYSISLQLVKMRPYLGYGGRTLQEMCDFNFFLGQHSINSSCLHILRWSHNAFLEFCMNYGLVALFFFILMCIFLLKELSYTARFYVLVVIFPIFFMGSFFITQYYISLLFLQKLFLEERKQKSLKHQVQRHSSPSG